jgi:hypothetical protein
MNWVRGHGGTQARSAENTRRLEAFAHPLDDSVFVRLARTNARRHPTVMVEHRAEAVWESPKTQPTWSPVR